MTWVAQDADTGPASRRGATNGVVGRSGVGPATRGRGGVTPTPPDRRCPVTVPTADKPNDQRCDLSAPSPPLSGHSSARSDRSSTRRCPRRRALLRCAVLQALRGTRSSRASSCRRTRIHGLVRSARIWHAARREVGRVDRDPRVSHERRYASRSRSRRPDGSPRPVGSAAQRRYRCALSLPSRSEAS